MENRNNANGLVGHGIRISVMTIFLINNEVLRCQISLSSLWQREKRYQRQCWSGHISYIIYLFPKVWQLLSCATFVASVMQRLAHIPRLLMRLLTSSIIICILFLDVVCGWLAVCCNAVRVDGKFNGCGFWVVGMEV